MEDAVNQFATLPGIGKKTALRLVLHMLKKDSDYAENFSKALVEMRNGIKRCTKCCNISDTDLCDICQDRSRRHGLICVVESIRDVMAIEATGQFRGVYHVLGGVISPLDGVGPDELYIDQLVDRVNSPDVEDVEVIMAISPTIDGETTSFYLYKLLSKLGISISQISRGVAFGGELEYTDEITLGRSIASRMPYSTGGKVQP